MQIAREILYLKRDALGIAAVYALFGLLWILASERLLPVLPSSAFLTFFVTYREALYITNTACLLCLLLRTHLLKIRKLESSLSDTTSRANHPNRPKRPPRLPTMRKLKFWGLQMQEFSIHYLKLTGDSCRTHPIYVAI